MKKCLSVLLFLSFTCLSFAQTLSLKVNGITLTLKKVDTLLAEEFEAVSDTAILKSFQPDAYVRKTSNSRLRVISSPRYSRAFAYKSFVKSTEPIFRTEFYSTPDGDICAPTSIIYLQPTDASDLREIEKYGELKAASQEKGFYYLHVTSKEWSTGEKIILLCNLLMNERKTKIAEPNFLYSIKLTTPLPGQWNIKNTGSSSGVTGATAGSDMKVENAWCYSTGQNIKVAVIDCGVDLTHPDLAANLQSGYDALGVSAGGASSSPAANNHGTACAGIIAALNNNSGPVGVAYNAKIIPIRLAIVDAFGSFYADDIDFVNCFDFATDNGADIISNSYGKGAAYSTSILQAITRATTNGRANKGSIVLFSSGNFSSASSIPENQVMPSASMSNVISVGASTPCDTRKSTSSCDGETLWASHFGSALDVVAPGVHIPTTDLSGANGSNVGDFMNNFGGTSAACPNAAAVCALILSANPNLTGVEAREILERTADKTGGYSYAYTSGYINGTWNSEMGYGRLNAYNAVQSAIRIGGNSLLCTSGNYTISSIAAGAAVSWSATPSGIVNISGSGSTVTITRSGTASGMITLTATLTNGCANGMTFQRDIWVGAPDRPIAYDEFDEEMSTLMMCTGNPQQIFVRNQTEVTSYTWTKVTGTYTMMAGGSLATIYSPVPANGFIDVRANNACGQSMATFVVISIQDCMARNGLQATSIKVYPNPVSNVLKAIVQDKTIQSGRASLINLQGQIIRQGVLRNGMVEFQTTGLPSGIYILNITGEKVTAKWQILIRH